MINTANPDIDNLKSNEETPKITPVTTPHALNSPARCSTGVQMGWESPDKLLVPTQALPSPLIEKENLNFYRLLLYNRPC
jgi:hypothetical protein